MKKRAYVLIFFFWAFLTIITPTLVEWSAAAADEAKTGSSSIIEEPTKARKMMELFQDIRLRKTPPLPSPPPRPPPPPPPAAPAPEEDDMIKKQEVVKDEGFISKIQMTSESGEAIDFADWVMEIVYQPTTRPISIY